MAWTVREIRPCCPQKVAVCNELSMTENLIARYRENYNGTVNAYERYIRQFPAALFLPLTGYQDQVFKRIDFEVSPDAPQDLFGRRRNTQ